MGYYSSFNIEAHEGDLTAEIKERLEEISDYAFDIDKHKDKIIITSCDSYKWYDCHNDMTRLSEEFPSVLFSLTWIGEDDERGRTYYFNGKSQNVQVQITYPKPNMKKLKG